MFLLCWCVMMEDGKWHGMKRIPRTAPHTYEDSVMSVRFMVSKHGVAAGKNYDGLYLLRSEREYMPNPSGISGHEDHVSVADFMLYKLCRDDDFGIYYLHQVARTRTARKYCNVDWAMHEALGIALPEDNPEQYVCVATPQ